MQPYQEASQESQRQANYPLDIAKKAVSLGSTAATLGSSVVAGSKLLQKITPFLSKYIPEDLAIKGLSKIDPRFGKFIEKAQSAGQSFDEIKNFISEKAEEVDEKPAKENRNIIEKESPELHEFISQHIASGRSPAEAAMLAKKEDKFKRIIGKLSQSHKAPWLSIIESIFGSQPMGQSKATLQEQQPDQQQIVQGQMQQGQQQQNPGQGQQALMAILQKINQRMGGGQ